ERGADEPDAPAGPLRADEHQRVARPGAEVGTDVERGSGPDERDPDEQQRNANREPGVRERRERMDRRESLDEGADEDRVCDGAEARPSAERPADEGPGDR